MRRLRAQGCHPFTAEAVDGVEELRVEALLRHRVWGCWASAPWW